MFASLLIQAVTLRDSLRTAPIGSFRFPAFAGCAGRSPCEMRVMAFHRNCFFRTGPTRGCFFDAEALPGGGAFSSHNGAGNVR